MSLSDQLELDLEGLDVDVALDHGSLPPLDFSNMSTMCTTSVDTITIGSQVLQQNSGSSGVTWSNPIYTASANFGNIGGFTSPAMLNQSGMLELQGEGADIKINGHSLTQTLQTIQDRLNMLRPNPELEKDWDQLRELGDQYRRLEAEFKEKQKAWESLQQQG
jgi:hypothetical protein